MTSNEVRQRFLNFFEERGHKVVSSSSLVPEGDPSVLFTTAGMQQFKGYYTAPNNAVADFGSKNVVSVQKCIRTGDIDEVGDDTHRTFLEMLGNFSFGGYWKKEAIKYAYEFITKELGLKIDYVSVFEGDEETPADLESSEIWKKIDPDLEIRNHNRADNFWGPTGDEGPCGPTTEIYVNGVEIWNIVFNEFYKTKEGEYRPLEVKGIDTGMGLERLMVQVQKKNNVYETDLFNGEVTKQKRIISDHIKASIFMVSDGVVPSNKGAGYVLRRLIRTVASMKVDPALVKEILNTYFNKYSGIYNIKKVESISLIWDELEAFKQGEKEVEKQLRKKAKEYSLSKPLTGYEVFGVSSTLGVRPENVIQKANELGIPLSANHLDERQKAFEEHQGLSRTASAGMFKGGLANVSEKTIKLHTAHHLLLAALQEVLGKAVKQKGSNINEERLRMDFSFSRKLTDEELGKVEKIVNENIKAGHSVTRKEMSKIEAETIGAEMEFGAKYPEVVSIYFIEDKDGNVVSKEFCGGPHVNDTSELGLFKILKEEAVASGTRRIKATLE